MKVICLQKNLKQNLNIAEKIVGKNLSLPVLGNFLLKTEKGRLKISSTNLEIGIQCWTLGKVEEEGAITCSAKLLTNYINNLPDKKITLQAKGNNLNINCEDYSANLRGGISDDFPTIPKVSGKNIIIVKNSILKEALPRIVNMASSSESRPEFSGIFFGFSKSGVRIAATDSFRLAERILNVDYQGEEFGIIMPQKTIQEIIRIVSDIEDGDVSINLNDNQVCFEFENIQLVSRLIEGQYPDYKEIIPKKFETKIAVDKNELMDKIRVASLFSSKINDVQLNINSENSLITILSQDVDLGENKTTIKAEISGKSLTISFNWRYFLDGLNNISDDKLIIGLNGELKPVLLQSVKYKDYSYVIMPIRIN